MIVTLNQFISQLTDSCRPFFQLLHKWKGFEWTEECSSAIQQLKEYLTRPLFMSKPEKEGVLFAYIATASHSMSLVLIRVDDEVQRPVYDVTNHYLRQRFATYPWRRLFWQRCMLRESSLITSKFTSLWSSPSFPFNHYFGGLTIQGGLQNG